MAVTVKIPTILRPLTNQQKRVDAVGANIGEIIEHLEQFHPGMKERLVHQESVHQFINIYVNSEDIRFGEDLATLVKDGDIVNILPAVAGG